MRSVRKCSEDEFVMVSLTDQNGKNSKKMTEFLEITGKGHYAKICTWREPGLSGYSKNIYSGQDFSLLLLGRIVKSKKNVKTPDRGTQGCLVGSQSFC